MTGGVLSFGQIGALAGPFVFSLLLYATGGYAVGWAVCAVPALWVGIALLRAPATPGAYQAVQPPSTSNDEPVTRPAAGEARNTTA